MTKAERILVLIVLLWTGYAAYGQRTDSSATPIQTYRFGFLLGANSTKERVTARSKDFGFSFGMTAEYHLVRSVYLYSTPMITAFTYSDQERTIEAAAIEIPVHLLVKPFKGKFQPTLSFGPNYKLFMDGPPQEGLFAEVALGVERYLKYFSVGPEFRFSTNGQIQTFYVVLNFKA